MIFVVDVNVPITSDGKSPQGVDCVTKCQEFIGNLVRNHKLALDSRGHIMAEYTKHLEPKRAPTISAEFYRWAMSNRVNPEKCDLVDIHPNRERVFDEFPNDKRLKRFHRDDRKYIAVAIAHPGRPTIAQAVDTKWKRYERPLGFHGVRILFLNE